MKSCNTFWAQEGSGMGLKVCYLVGLKEFDGSGHVKLACHKKLHCSDFRHQHHILCLFPTLQLCQELFYSLHIWTHKNTQQFQSTIFLPCTNQLWLTFNKTCYCYQLGTLEPFPFTSISRSIMQHLATCINTEANYWDDHDALGNIKPTNKWANNYFGQTTMTEQAGITTTTPTCIQYLWPSVPSPNYRGLKPRLNRETLGNICRLVKEAQRSVGMPWKMLH